MRISVVAPQPARPRTTARMTQRNAITSPGKRHQQNDDSRAISHPSAGRSRNQMNKPEPHNSHRSVVSSRRATGASTRASARRPTISATQTRATPRSTVAAPSR